MVLLKEGIILMANGVDVTDHYLHLIPMELYHTPESAIFREQLQHDLGVLDLSPYAAPTCALMNPHTHRVPSLRAQHQPQEVHREKNQHYQQNGEPPPACDAATKAEPSMQRTIGNLPNPPGDVAETPEGAKDSIEESQRRPPSPLAFPPEALTWRHPGAADKE